ncbi:unnamed protein product, partial [Effrenium voratum]
LINQATKPWCQHQVVKGCRWDRITTSAPRCPFSNRAPPAIVLLWTFNYWLPLVGDGLLAAPKWTCEDLQRLSLRLGFEAQRAPLALAQLPLQWLRLAAGTEQALQLPGSLKELELHLESPTEEFLLALPLLESLALFSPSVGAAALCAAAARATRRLRLRLGTAGEALAFAAVLPATLEELCLEVAEGDISSGAIALLAKHCPPNLAKLDLSIGELRIDSTQRLAEFCAEKEASAVPDAEAPDTDAGGVSQVQRTEAGGTWAV